MSDGTPTGLIVAIGIVLIIAALPLALSLGPLVLGIFLAALGLRRAHIALNP